MDNLLDNYRLYFLSAVQNVFTKFFYPTKNGLTDANINLIFSQNKYDGEEQIRNALTDKRKFTTDISSQGFLLQLETKLFAGQKKRPWSEVQDAAASDTSWLWYKPTALEQVKDEQKRKDNWREEGNWIHIGPFEKPETEVQIEVLGINDSNGKTRLKIKPVRGNAIYYEYGNRVSENNAEWDTHDNLETDEMQVAFLCVDKKGEHKTGPPFVWQNEIRVKYEFAQQGDEFLVTLQATPRNIEIRYSTDGSNPLHHGGVYTGPFLAKPKSKILALGVKGDFQSKSLDFDLPKANDTTVNIRKEAGLTYLRLIQYDTTAEAYQIIGLLKKFKAELKGPEINSQKNQFWAVLQTAETLAFPAETVEKHLRFIQDEVFGEGEFSLKIQKTIFPTGQDFIDFAREASITYKPQDFEQ